MGLGKICLPDYKYWRQQKIKTMLTAIILISFLSGLYLLFWYWEKLAKKEAKEDYPKAGKGKVISLDDSEDFY